MSSSNTQPATSRELPESIAAASLPQLSNVEVDEDTDGSYDNSYFSDTTSINSSIARGIVQNGRRYQSLREGDYWGPADDKQFEAMEKGHLVHLVLDANEENPFFRSPIGPDPKHIIDIGAGQGEWAIDVAERFPSAQVLGIDLFPPPQGWTPPNCTFEVDDANMAWDRSQKFDLVHLRWMLGAFTKQQWTEVYKQAYENLAPGGWIEHLEPSLVNSCDDGTMPADSKQAQWGPMFYKCGKAWGRPLDIFETMKADITAAGFTNVQEQLYKIPIGPWPKHPLYKEAGKWNLDQLLTGLEGYALMLLTKFGEPTPWSIEEVQAFLEGMREEMMDRKRHTYIYTRRVWAQKPLKE